MTREERKQHFIARLSERYGISVTSDEFEDICTWVGGQSEKNRTNCKRLLKISYNLRAYSLQIRGKNVLALYSTKDRIFTTALPADSYYDPERMVPKIFRKKKLVKEAVDEYNRVLEVCCSEYKDLGDSRKNWDYYNTCTYPMLMVEEYKSGMTVRSVYRQVLMNMKETLGIEDGKIKFLV